MVTSSGMEGFEFARRALQAVSNLGMNQSAQVLERLKTGYYTSEEVTQELAQRIAEDMGPECGARFMK